MYMKKGFRIWKSGKERNERMKEKDRMDEIEGMAKMNVLNGKKGVKEWRKGNGIKDLLYMLMD